MVTRANSLSKKLTSKEAARLLGVSEASVKRWADGGLLPMVKTAGGHRRFRPEDVAVFRRRNLKEAGGAAERVSGQTRQASDVTLHDGAKRVETAGRLYDALVAGHADEAAAILVSLHLDGVGVAALADEILCPAMRRVGALGHQGELSVAQEHVATRAALEAVHALRSSLDAREAHGQRAVCCAAEDDFHELPVQVASLTLEAGGWEVVNLGTSTPFYALAEAIERIAPRIVCVASTILEGLDRAAREFGDVRRAAARFGAGLVLGGAGFAGEDLRRRFPAELYAEGFTQLEEFAASLSEGGGHDVQTS